MSYTWGFSNPDGRTIHQWVYPAAQSYAARWYAKFFDEVAPTTRIEFSSYGWYSGLVGVPLNCHIETGSWRQDVYNVEWQYNLNADKSGPWTSISTSGASITRDDDLENHFDYSYTWHNSLNATNIWVRCRASDDSRVKSKWSEAQISIDSTRPRVTNKRK